MKYVGFKSDNTSRTPQADATDSSLSARLLEAQDQERRRISRELHDGVGQALVSAKLNLGKLKKRLGVNIEELNELEATLDGAVAEVRAISHLLHPPTLDMMGLRSAILWYAEGFQQRTGIQTSVEIPASLPKFASETETALFRVLQECLTNVHKHARATKVSIQVVFGCGEFRLELKDDGIGFESDCYEGVGIRGMRERLKELNGSLRVKSANGSGTSLVATIPLGSARPDLDATSNLHDLPQNPIEHECRILVIDDHEVMRRGIRSLIDSQPGLTICGEAASAKEGLELLERLRPHVTLLDLQLPDKNGWALLREARKMRLPTRVIVFTQHDERFAKSAAKAAGCQGFVSKSRAAEDLVAAIREVSEGNTFFDSHSNPFAAAR